MRTFVTGANGFIGSNLVKKLLEKGHSVKALVLPGTDIKNIESSGCEIIHGDILNPHEFEKHLENVQIIFHLAAKVSDWGRWKEFYKINVEGTKKLIRSAVKKGVRRFLFVSSLAVHKPTGYKDGDENAPRNNVNFPYALSKIMIEDFLNECHSKGMIESVIIRPGLFPFGPEDRRTSLRLAQALEKGFFAFVNGGEAFLCTAYVENLAEGIILAGEKDIARGNVYIIGDNVKIRWKELIQLFAQNLNIKPPNFNVPFSLAKTLAVLMETGYKIFAIKSPPPLTTYRISIMAKDFYFNSNKAMRELGYKPSVTLEEGVRRTIEWYRSIKRNGQITLKGAG